jgi:peptide/nickel transport system substrate-binding protein
MPFNPKGLHPTNDMDAGKAHIYDFTQRALFKIDLRTNKHVPLLIKAIPVPDSSGTIYLMELRKGIKWDDGSPLTVDDVIFSAKMVMHPLTANPGLKGVFLSVIKSIKPGMHNSNCFYMQAHQAHNGNLEIFTELYILQKKRWDPHGLLDSCSFENMYSPQYTPAEKLKSWFGKFNSRDNAFLIDNLTGLGPYKITEWLPDSHITLVKKKDWWGDHDTVAFNQNEPDKIIFRIIKDDAAVYLAIKNGKLDATNKISTTRLLKLRKQKYFNANYRWKMVKQFAYLYIGLNMKPNGTSQLPFFTDKRVRRAMAHLVPVDDLIKVFSKGQADRQITNVSPLKTDFNHTLPAIDFSIQKANELLDAAGWHDTDNDQIRDKLINGKKIQFIFKFNYIAEQPGGKETALLIKDCLKKAGIEMIPTPMDLAHFYESAYMQKFDAMMGSWLSSAGYDDPGQLWHTDQWKNFGNNFCGFGNSKSDSLINVVNTTMETGAFINASHALQKMIYDEQPYIFLYSPRAKIVIHNRFNSAGMFSEKPNLYVNTFTLLPKYATRNTPSAE